MVTFTFQALSVEVIGVEDRGAYQLAQVRYTATGVTEWIASTALLAHVNLEAPAWVTVLGAGWAELRRGDFRYRIERP